MLLALRRRWHEGPADTTLLTSLRGWVSALLSRMGTQEMLSVMPPIAVSRWRVNPRQMGSRRLPARQRDRRPGSLKITSSCAEPPAASLSRRLLIRTFALVRAVSAPVRRHPSCQRRRAASLFELGRVGDGKLTSELELVCSRCSIDRVFPNPFFLSGVSCLSPSLRHRKTNPPLRGAF